MRCASDAMNPVRNSGVSDFYQPVTILHSVFVNVAIVETLGTPIIIPATTQGNTLQRNHRYVALPKLPEKTTNIKIKNDKAMRKYIRFPIYSYSLFVLPTLVYSHLFYSISSYDNFRVLSALEHDYI